MERIKVSEKGTAILVCPHCGSKKNVSVDKFKGTKHTIKPRCSCGESFVTHLNFRSTKRKKTDLQGSYNITSNGGGQGAAAITSLSKNGIGFSVSGMHDIKVGQTGLIDFVLDNRKSTRLSKEVIIQSVTKNRIGCLFSPHQPFEKDFEFYLQS